TGSGASWTATRTGWRGATGRPASTGCSGTATGTAATTASSTAGSDRIDLVRVSASRSEPRDAAGGTRTAVRIPPAFIEGFDATRYQCNQTDELLRRAGGGGRAVRPLPGPAPADDPSAPRPPPSRPPRVRTPSPSPPGRPVPRPWP